MGWAVPPNDYIRAAFERELPQVPIERLCAIAKDYAAARSLKMPGTKDRQRSFNALNNQLDSLVERLQAHIPGLAEVEARRGGNNSRHALAEQVKEFQEMLWEAERQAPSRRHARPGTERTLMVHQLADALTEMGIVADHRPTGPLCRGTAIVLEHAGERVTNVHEVVESALKKRV